VLRDLKAGALDREMERGRRELLLQVGAPGRLLLAGAVKNVLPLDDAEALDAAKPVADGKVRIDEAKMDARRRAIGKNRPAAGVALVVLGGAHDLGPHLPDGALYIAVTVRSYPE